MENTPETQETVITRTRGRKPSPLGTIRMDPKTGVHSIKVLGPDGKGKWEYMKKPKTPVVAEVEAQASEKEVVTA